MSSRNYPAPIERAKENLKEVLRLFPARNLLNLLVAYDTNTVIKHAWHRSLSFLEADEGWVGREAGCIVNRLDNRIWHSGGVRLHYPDHESKILCLASDHDYHLVSRDTVIAEIFNTLQEQATCLT